ncbi:10916_t:CDS:2 [Funneliformis geosporum]|uniref:1026_t:CDS:1 n=1 Tax=Funneliformis geosporum TaxID=1117311 RepID=A0A9W4SDI0_9GLOM|nr:1026_t:CDS:2 [Funneliformis geosporum]CAI2163495.1 10916_t:CDS:2 [Funneliformis geosporum]
MAFLKNILYIFLLTVLFFAPLLAFGDDSKETVFLPPDTVEITGEFTDNPFSHIVNGQKNTIKVTFDNKGETNYTITMIGGALVNKDNPSEIFRNLTAYKYNHIAPSMDHVDLIYNFYAEFPPQELDLLLYILFADENLKKFKGVAYNGTVTVVDPDVSIFDLQLLFMWLILIMGFGGFLYMIYQVFFGGVKPKKTKRAPVVKTETTDTGTSDLKYDESWIPEHHLKPQTRTSSRKKKNDAKKD